MSVRRAPKTRTTVPHAREFVRTELACMQATIDNLLEHYVRPGSELAVRLQHVCNCLDMLGACIDAKYALRNERLSKRRPRP